MDTRIAVVAIGTRRSWLYFVWNLLRGDPANLHYVSDPKSGLQSAIASDARVVFIDPAMADLDISDLLRRIFRDSPATQMALVAGQETGDAAILAMRSSRADYRSKFVHLRDVRAYVSRSLKSEASETAPSS